MVDGAALLALLNRYSDQSALLIGLIIYSVLFGYK